MKWLYQKVKNLSLSLLPIVLCDWVINGSEEMGNMILHNQKQNIYFLMVKKNCTYQKVTPHPHPLLGVENNHSKWPTIKLSCFLYQSPLPFFFFFFFQPKLFFPPNIFTLRFWICCMALQMTKYRSLTKNLSAWVSLKVKYGCLVENLSWLIIVNLRL